MSRTITPTIKAAQENESYVFLSKLRVYPTRMFFDALDSDFPISGADAAGVVDDPIPQDIVYNETAGGLVTFFTDGLLKYAVQGSNTATSLAISSDTKPGVFGNKLFVYTGTTLNRYSISWGGLGISEDISISLSKTPVAIHAISETECIAICDDDGGFRVLYINDLDEKVSSSRFMFPSSFDWYAEEDTPRTMAALGVFSGAAMLNGMPFAYVSNAGTGMVQGMSYDPETDTWGDIFIALPTDRQVSLCEFRIANCYTRNNFVYMAGQFNRTDVYGTAKVYSLILRSSDGKTFSIDNFTLVSDLNYRFLATIGSNDQLYIGNCNRVAAKPLTWYFDGDGYSISSQVLELTESDFRSISDTDTNSLSVVLRSGDETLFDGWVQQYSMVESYHGFKTAIGDEWILYGTYIIERVPRGFKNGGRNLSFQATGYSLKMLSGLTMPFYAEISGVSSLYDPMNAVTGKLYAAPNMAKTSTKFQVDFWRHKGYSKVADGITAMVTEGGPPEFTMTGAHKFGIITKDELFETLGLGKNPKITGTTLDVKIYGWSKPDASGQPNDTINLILVHCDEKGDDEQTIITTGTAHWKITYPYTAAGSEPISITVPDLTVGRYIKFAGLVFEAPNSTFAVPARIEFTNNVEVPMNFSNGDIPWTLGTDGSFTCPGAGQPFIMFTQRPYNTQNFILAAYFSNTIEGGITGYPVAVGLVGLAQDASNCIVARYNKTNNKVELAKLRNGVETTLGSATPSWTVPEAQMIQFKHRDGHFEIFIFKHDESHAASQYELVLSYDWKATDGYMYTSKVATMKCGIYGLISAPTCRILSFYKDSSGAKFGDGIPVDPLSDIDDFPNTGNVRIGETVYSYTGKISIPALPRGPYQLRNVGVYGTSVGGNNEPGIECRDMDWNASNTTTAGNLIAIDNGLSFISTGSFWKVYTIDHGTKRYLPNRARYYTANPAIAESVRYSTNNRVWITGGLTGIELVSGEPLRHSVGDAATYNLSGEIKCHWFMGAGGEADTTIEDLISRICRLSGSHANFPGNFKLASLVVNGETQIYQDDYAEGFDMSFNIPAPANFDIRTNVKILPDNYEDKDIINLDTGTTLKVQSYGSGNYVVSLLSTPSGRTMFRLSYSSGLGIQKMRVMYHGNNVSFYQNGKWIVTITLDGLIYTQTTYLDIKAYASTPITFSDIDIADLSDWREAIYIDLETDGNSAIGSVIQERPIEIVSQPNGSVDFFYEYVRPEVDLVFDIQMHEFSEADPDDAASDGIIYGAGDVQTIQYRKFAASKGLATRLIRIPNIDIGALQAAQRLLDRAYESRGQHSITMRPNLEVQPGDVVNFTWTVSGTGTTKSFSIIAESVSLSVNMADGRKTSSMSIKGRNKLT